MGTKLSAPLLWGILCVADPPRYHDPMSVNSPFSVNMAELGPTFETSDRKAPKYEYRVMLLEYFSKDQ